MSLKMWLLALLLTLIMVISSTVSGADQPTIFDAAYDLGAFWLKENTQVNGIVPFSTIKVAIEHPTPQFSKWYDPFYDDLGWALMKDSAAFGSAVHSPFSPAFKLAGGFLTLAQYQNDAIIKWENEHGVTDFWLSVWPHEPLDSSSGSASSSSKLAKHGLGAPQLSPSTADTFGFSTQNSEGANAPKITDNADGTYLDKKTDVWYVDAFEWSGDRGLPKPAAPLHFVSGELNTYGYNWVYLPYSQTGMTYSPGYRNWVEEYLASIGSAGTGAGVGTLIDESSRGSGDW